MKMILNIDPFKSALASISSALIGSAPKYLTAFTLMQANTFFQHLAWTIAALAGLISILNGITKFIDWLRKDKTAKVKEDEQDN